MGLWPAQHSGPVPHLLAGETAPRPRSAQAGGDGSRKAVSSQDGLLQEFWGTGSRVDVTRCPCGPRVWEKLGKLSLDKGCSRT